MHFGNMWCSKIAIEKQWEKNCTRISKTWSCNKIKWKVDMSNELREREKKRGGPSLTRWTITGGRASKDVTRPEKSGSPGPTHCSCSARYKRGLLTLTKYFSSIFFSHAKYITCQILNIYYNTKYIICHIFSHESSTRCKRMFSLLLIAGTMITNSNIKYTEKRQEHASQNKQMSMSKAGWRARRQTL